MDTRHWILHDVSRLRARIVALPARVLASWLVVFFFLVSILYVRSVSSRDPGSWFFNPSTAYDRQYSAIREEEAIHFVSDAATTPFKSHEGIVPLCVGIPSIARHGARYLRSTVGSLLAGLTPQERDGLHLIVFIPHTDPNIHPAYSEPWLSNLADEVLTYNLTKEQHDHIVELEKDHGLMREKGLFDYTYLLKRCHATQSPYIAMIEDDTIALDGWYHRTIQGLQIAEVKAAKQTALRHFLYLRLFYTEEFLGWNSESWSTYLFWSLTAFAVSLLVVHLCRNKFPDVKRNMSPTMSISLCLAVVPLAILLFFAAGKVTTLPLPSGVNSMNNFGCCAQGLVFPREKAKFLIEWFESKRIGFADMLIEDYANEHDEQRYALTPSVLQHIGSKSSKLDDFGHGAKYSKSVAENIWNFAFELNTPGRLRQEHEMATVDANEPLR